MTIGANRHHKLHLILLDMAGVDARLGRDDIVERREPEASARSEADAEIFRMAVRSAEKPEYDLRFKECSLVGVRLIAALGKVCDFADAGSPV